MKTHQQLCSRVLSKSYLRNLTTSAISTLSETGYFTEDNEAQIHSSFMPWLYDEVFEKLVKTTNYSDLINRMAQQFEESVIEIHIQSLENYGREKERAEKADAARKEAKLKRREEKKIETAKIQEEERIHDLRARLTTTLVRPERVKTKGLIFSDCNGIEDSNNREVVGTSGGLVYELYLLFEIIQKIGTKDEMPTINLAPENVRNVLKPLFENWLLNDFVFEIGVKPQLTHQLSEAKESIFGSAVDIYDFKNLFEIFVKIPEENKDERIQLFLKVVSSHITFFLEEADQIIHNNLKDNLENSIDAASKTSSFKDEKGDTQRDLDIKGEISKENAVHGSVSKEEVTATHQAHPEEGSENIFTDEQLEFSIDTSWKGFNSDILNKVKYGLVKYIFEENHEKGNRYALIIPSLESFQIQVRK